MPYRSQLFRVRVLSDFSFIFSSLTASVMDSRLSQIEHFLWSSLMLISPEQIQKEACLLIVLLPKFAFSEPFIFLIIGLFRCYCQTSSAQLMTPKHFPLFCVLMSIRSLQYFDSTNKKKSSWHTLARYVFNFRLQ